MAGRSGWVGVRKAVRRGSHSDSWWQHMGKRSKEGLTAGEGFNRREGRKKEGRLKLGGWWLAETK
ncbi:hypothetical protein RT717_19920 [Imperialibacter roseus]|uniref:Uncharacterized protein n=1 Tax=Imperialibacter roseus TaxID=1324217 RepID=A0ABZ0ILF0_9BACT|nr:hypothetical protein [Imperialibacter roseus]WOK05351.1 hypothetical protein RT717_19920 [Imperialibacter roseus]